MAFLSPNGFDNFQVGEPSPVLRGKVSTLSLDQFQMGEPTLGLLSASALVVQVDINVQRPYVSLWMHPF